MTPFRSEKLPGLPCRALSRCFAPSQVSVFVCAGTGTCSMGRAWRRPRSPRRKLPAILPARMASSLAVYVAQCAQFRRCALVPRSRVDSRRWKSRVVARRIFCCVGPLLVLHVGWVTAPLTTALRAGIWAWSAGGAVLRRHSEWAAAGAPIWVADCPSFGCSRRKELRLTWRAGRWCVAAARGCSCRAAHGFCWQRALRPAFQPSPGVAGATAVRCRCRGLPLAAQSGCFRKAPGRLSRWPGMAAISKTGGKDRGAMPLFGAAGELLFLAICVALCETRLFCHSACLSATILAVSPVRSAARSCI